MKKNTKFVVKLVVGTAVIGVATTGFIMKHEGFDFKKIDFRELFPKKEEEVIEQEPETEDYTQVETIEEQLGSVDNTDYDYAFDEYSETLEEYDEHEEEYAENYQDIEIPEEVVELDDSELPQEFSAITEKVNTNIFQISDFINGESLPDTPYYVDFSDWLNNDNDRYVVGYFAALYNGIKTQAYDNDNREATIEAVAGLLNVYDQFTNGYSLSFDDDGDIIELTYDDISPRAKAIIIPMAQALTMIDYDFQLDNGRTVLDVLEETCTEYDIAMTNLEGRSR